MFLPIHVNDHCVLFSRLVHVVVFDFMIYLKVSFSLMHRTFLMKASVHELLHQLLCTQGNSTMLRILLITAGY
jgi:hypothetical protein